MARRHDDSGGARSAPGVNGARLQMKRREPQRGAREMCVCARNIERNRRTKQALAGLLPVARRPSRGGVFAFAFQFIKFNERQPSRIRAHSQAQQIRVLRLCGHDRGHVDSDDACVCVCGIFSTFVVFFAAMHLV